MPRRRDGAGTDNDDDDDDNSKSCLFKTMMRRFISTIIISRRSVELSVVCIMEVGAGRLVVWTFGGMGS